MFFTQIVRGTEPPGYTLPQSIEVKFNVQPASEKTPTFTAKTTPVEGIARCEVRNAKVNAEPTAMPTRHAAATTSTAALTLTLSNELSPVIKSN